MSGEFLARLKAKRPDVDWDTEIADAREQREKKKLARKMIPYWEEVRRTIRKGTRSLLWGTSTRSLRRSLNGLRKVTSFDPQVGDIVCDCRFMHLRVIKRDGDDLVLENGFRCSLKHCCDPPDHPEAHPVT